MKKGCATLLAALIAFSALAEHRNHLAAEEADGAARSGDVADREKARRNKAARTKAEDGDGGRVRDLTPARGESVSMPAVLLLDLAVPGGGHFYLGNEYTGYTFLGLKLLGAYTVYYCFRDWQYRRSLYRAARRANSEMDPDHALEFEDPHGGYNTVEEFRRDYDRAAQRITFSVIANVAVYAVSLMMAYQAAKKINTESLPTFELQYSRANLTPGDETTVTAAVTSRF